MTTVYKCGRISVVECQLPKLDVVGSNPIARCFHNLRPHKDFRDLPTVGSAT